MSLEHTLLNRLEARSMQLAQMKKEIHGLKLLVDEKMTINESLAAEVTRERETARANYEHMERQITGLRGECEQLRREVPLESTREALKNTVAKLQEVTTDRDRLQNELAAIYAEANKSGYCNGDPVAQIKKGQADHDIVQSMERQLEAYSSLSNARAHEIARLNAKVGPLEKCYDKLKAISRENGIITSRFKEVLTVIDETTESLSQLTA